MANVFAAYVSSDAEWTFQKGTYNRDVGFYDNAWMVNERTSEDVPHVPCTFFYQRNKEDETGFTPALIDYNESNGLLSVEGKQKGVPRQLRRAYMVGANAPRFLNLRESEISRRPAQFTITSIITDSDEELTNIKDFVGLNTTEEEPLEASAEEFGAEGKKTSPPWFPPHHYISREELEREKKKNWDVKDADEFAAERIFVEQEDGDLVCVGTQGGWGHDWEFHDTADEWLLMNCKACKGKMWFTHEHWMRETKPTICKECEKLERDCSCDYCSECGHNLDNMFGKHCVDCEGCHHIRGGCCSCVVVDSDHFETTCNCKFEAEEFGAEKRNCGCGQDPCITYGAEGVECIDLISTYAEPTRNFYRVRFRNPKWFKGGKYSTPKWGQRAAMTIGRKYYGVPGCKITMAQPKDGRWKIQNVLIPKNYTSRDNQGRFVSEVEMTEELALRIANHIQDRIEREGKWAKKVCRDGEMPHFVSRIKGQHIVRDSTGRFAKQIAAEDGRQQ